MLVLTKTPNILNLQSYKAKKSWISSPKPNDIQLTIIHDEEKNQILTLEKPEPDNNLYFNLFYLINC